MKIVKALIALLIVGMLLAGAYYVFKSLGGRGQYQEQKDYLVRIKKDCTIQPRTETTILMETKKIRFLAVKMTEKKANELKNDKCVVRVLTPREAREKYESLPEGVKEAVREKIRELKLKRTILDVPEVPEELISKYQLYVTPDDPVVQSLSKEVYGLKGAYATAVDWV